jgi:hypothetical protein
LNFFRAEMGSVIGLGLKDSEVVENAEVVEFRLGVEVEEKFDDRVSVDNELVAVDCNISEAKGSVNEVVALEWGEKTWS